MFNYKIIYAFTVSDLEYKVEQEFKKSNSGSYLIKCLGGVQITVINNTNTFYQSIGRDYETLD